MTCLALLKNTARLKKVCVRVSAHFPPVAAILCLAFNGRNVKEGAVIGEGGPVTTPFNKPGFNEESHDSGYAAL